MPGKWITNNQIRLFMQSKERGKSVAVAAAQAGFSERSAHNIASRSFEPQIENETGRLDQTHLKQYGTMNWFLYLTLRQG